MSGALVSVDSRPLTAMGLVVASRCLQSVVDLLDEARAFEDHSRVKLDSGAAKVQ